MKLERNLKMWNSVEHWETGNLGNGVPLAEGEKWSQGWGSSRYQWYSSLLPRIHQFLPAERVIEIACGRGRWGQYLKEYCGHLTLQDISSTCVDYCRERFKDDENLDFIVGKGSDLPGIEDSSIDFVFSFDSLVHADFEIVLGYLEEIGRVLKPGGGAFLHHSNRAALGDETNLKSPHLRDPDVSADKILPELQRFGLACEIYELLPWDADQAAKGQCLDAFLSVKKQKQVKNPKLVKNTKSLEIEKMVAKQIANIYG